MRASASLNEQCVHSVKPRWKVCQRLSRLIGANCFAFLAAVAKSKARGLPSPNRRSSVSPWIGKH